MTAEVGKLTSETSQKAGGRVKDRNRVQLTWKHKDQALLSHGASTYEWVEPGDWRVSEVRLLEHVETVGEPSDNLLIEGDALYGLTSLSAIPEYAAKYKGKVKLCYIDPPFNTGQTFAHYKDSLENSIWLTMFRDRVQQVKELLSKDATIWVHLDDVQVHRARAILDEAFGGENFVATVIWEKTDSPRMDARQFSSSHDNMHIYSTNPDWAANRRVNLTGLSDFRFVDEDGRRYSRRELRKWGSTSLREDRPKLWYPLTAPDGTEVYPIRPDGKDGRWRWQLQSVLAEQDRIEWVDRGNGPEPYVKTYMDADRKPIPPVTLWPVTEVGGNPRATEELKALFPDREPFATPKPEALLQRVLDISTQPGDIVLDCFAGSGTTAAVAHKMGRRWVTVELIPNNVSNYIKPRLAKVVDGSDRGGISETVVEELIGGLPEGMEPSTTRKLATALTALDKFGTFDDLPAPTKKQSATAYGQILALLADDPEAHKELIKELAKQTRAAAKVQKNTVVLWEGCGGYTHVQVGPSLFEEVHGTIVLADWATGGALAEAVAAQMRFPYEPDGPFAGAKGRQRLAVIDGMLTTSLVDYLLGFLPENQTLIVVAQSMTPEAREHLMAARKGSRARKIPRDLAHISRRTERVDLSADVTGEDTDAD